MRKTFIGIAFFLILGVFNGVRAETPDSPNGIITFSVKIAADNAPVCSSPGEENYYQTGFLKAGDVVEICFRTDSGWCAIRPPEGSFSWINADYVNRRDQNSGTVVCSEEGKEVPVRVGADSVMKSSGVQVGLKNGREVKILGETTLTGGKTWLKIAPPRGEFRWINDSLLVRDHFFSQIPNRLTRYEDLLAQSEENSANSIREPVAEETNRLHEEIFDPVSEKTTPDNSTISNVSFENGFNKELAQLYRDLFTAVERSGSNEVYDLLAERASLLFTLAADDGQRAEAQKAFEKINAHRGATFAANNVVAGVGNELIEMESLYQAPTIPTTTGVHSTGLVRENERIVFSVAPKSEVRDSEKSTSRGDAVRFAFAPRNETVTNSGHKNKKGFFAEKPSPIVPPANYSYPAPALLKVAPQEMPAVGSGTSEGAPTLKADPVSNSGNAFLANSSETPKQEIRQVAAFVKPELPTETASNLPTSEAGPPAKLPISNAHYDAAGTLGYFPNQADGTPSYALVNQADGKWVILCYVAPQKGKSLDPFVGKKIGIGGSKGWFKKGEENRKIITVESIHLLEN